MDEAYPRFMQELPKGASGSGAGEAAIERGIAHDGLDAHERALTVTGGRQRPRDHQCGVAVAFAQLSSPGLSAVEDALG